LTEHEDDSLIIRKGKDGKPKVVAGTFFRLVELLTDERSQDPQFVKAFLLTYRSFCEPLMLLDALIERFEHPLPKNHDKIRKKHIRVRVWYVLKMWLEVVWEDVADNEIVREKMMNFVKKRWTNVQENCRSCYSD